MNLAIQREHIKSPQDQLASKKRLDALFRKPPVIPRAETAQIYTFRYRIKPVFVVDPNAPRSPWPRAEVGVTVHDVVMAVSSYLGVTPIEIKSARRTAETLRPRMICYYLAKELTLASYPQIGRILGGRDHTTIMAGYEKAKKRFAEDGVFAADINTIRARLEGGN